MDWIATFFGWIMNFIYLGLDKIGIANMGLCIIIFTVVTKLLLLPLTIKQAKSQKLQAVVQPEISAIQARYKGKENDQQAMMMQQAEIKAVYEKYGTSMTSGCLPLLIQLPIIFGLYQVIRNTPQYVASLRVYFENIIDAIGGDVIAKVNEFITKFDLTKILATATIKDNKVGSSEDIINFLSKLNPEQWDSFKNFFSYAADKITANVEKIIDINSFLGMDLATRPWDLGLNNWRAWIIPILAGLTQYASSKLMTAGQPKPAQSNDDSSKTANTMMNSMNVIMPIMSVVFCFTFASGIGVYWIAQAVVSGIVQVFINKKMNKLDVDELIRVNLEKTNKKRAKKGLPPVNEKAAEENYKKMQNQLKRMEAKRDAAVEKTKALREEANGYYKTGSIADRARMVQQYNEKNKK